MVNNLDDQDNKVNKRMRKRIKSNVKTIQSTTTKHRTIEEEESRSTLTKQTKTKHIRSVVFKKGPKNKSKQQRKMAKPAEKIINYEREKSFSILPTEILTESIRSIKQPIDIKIGTNTLNIINAMENEEVDGMTKKREVMKAEYQDDNKIQNYKKVFESALGKPPSMNKLQVDHFQEQNEEMKWVESMQTFKNQQRQNWRQIQRFLFEYVSKEEEQIGEKEAIESELLKQGRQNYRWMQISTYANNQQCKLMECMIKNTMVVEENPQYDSLQNNEDGKLPSYNWEKYIWRGESDSSASLYSEEPDVHVDLADPRQATIDENVAIILNWLIDEHVFEILHHIKLFTSSKLNQIIEPKSSKQQNTSKFIRQIHEDNLEIDKYLNGEGCREEIACAIEEVKIRGKYECVKQAGKTLRKMLMKRKDGAQTFPCNQIRQNKQLQYYRMTIVHQISEEIIEKLMSDIMIFLSQR